METLWKRTRRGGLAGLVVRRSAGCQGAAVVVVIIVPIVAMLGQISAQRALLRFESMQVGFARVCFFLHLPRAQSDGEWRGMPMLK